MPDDGPDAADAAATPEATPVAGAADLTPVDRFFYALSSAADHGLLWLALGALRGAAEGDPMMVVRLGAVLGAESVLTNGVVKTFFRRVRPQEHFVHDAPLPYGLHRPVTSSFPSGHAASAFTAAGALARGRSAPVWYVLAGLVAYSRVHVKMHHPADVVGGTVLGLVLGRLARRIVRP